MTLETLVTLTCLGLPLIKMKLSRVSGNELTELRELVKSGGVFLLLFSISGLYTFIYLFIYLSVYLLVYSTFIWGVTEYL